MAQLHPHYKLMREKYPRANADLQLELIKYPEGMKPIIEGIFWVGLGNGIVHEQARQLDILEANNV